MMLCIYIVFILFVNSLTAISDTTKVNNSLNGNEFKVFVFNDSLETLTPNRILSIKGQEISSNAINFRHSSGKKWIKFTATNPTLHDLKLIVHTDIVYLEHFQYYIYKNEKLITESQEYNWRTPISKRPVYNRYFSFPLELSANEVKTIVLSLEGSGGILFTPIYLYSESNFIVEQTKFDVLYTVTLSITFVFLITLFIIVLIYRKKIVTYLFIYCLGYLIYSLNLEGVLASYFSPIIGNIKWLNVGSSTASIFSFLFFLNLLTRNLGTLNAALIENSVLVLYFFLLISVFVLPYSSYHNILNQLVYYAFALGNIIFIILTVTTKSTNVNVFAWVILPAQILEVLINLYISGIIKISILSNYNIYHLKYIIPVYEFYTLGLATIFILFKDRERKTLELNRTKLEIINAAESEQQRLAKDLHDDLGGTLSIIKGKISIEKVSNETINLVEKVINDLRLISRNLMPPELVNDGLVDSVAQTIERVQQANQNVLFTFITYGKEKRLEEDKELNIYRIISELVNNIVKHSKASKASIQVIFYDTYLFLSVEDNGIGINYKTKTCGIGLKNINSRIEYLGATIHLDTGISGTTFMIKIPFSLNGSNFNS